MPPKARRKTLFDSDDDDHEDTKDESLSAKPSAELTTAEKAANYNRLKRQVFENLRKAKASMHASASKPHRPVMRDASTMTDKTTPPLLHLPPQQEQEVTPMQTDQQHLAGRIFTDAVTTPQWPTSNVTFSPDDVRRMSQSVPPNSAHPTTGQGVEMSKRTLPAREVTEQTIEEAYIAFILYCNPTIPTPKGQTDLGRTFRTPPKSDGKAFSTFRLFELIHQLENKEIKSWSQLALSLGVDPPDETQSSQKVQQYAVRLKRWMHAMHLDAFFAYCRGKPHTYYTVIPTEDGQMDNRDGVPREEDLALRALQPEKRTKRGRKKVEKDDAEEEIPMSATVNSNKRARLATPSDTAGDFDSFTHDTSELYSSTTVAPPTGQEEDIDRYTKQLDTWPETTGGMSTTTPGNAAQQHLQASNVFAAQSPTNRANSGNFGAQQFRWRLNAAENNHSANTPASLYPQSAMTPTAPHLPDNVFAEPMSAITPASAISGGMKGRLGGRRRHGPAVSSAWPTGGSSTPSGKFRGRPPSNRSVRDGPFSTFPANPKTRTGPFVEVPQRSGSGGGNTTSQLSTPMTGGGGQEWESHLTQSSPIKPTTAASALPPKPTKRASLQLQVPERKGGPIRLATPTTLRSLNGINNHNNSGINRSTPLRQTQDTTTTILNHSDGGEGGTASDSELFVSSNPQGDDAGGGVTNTSTSAHQAHQAQQAHQDFFPQPPSTMFSLADIISALANRFIQASFYNSNNSNYNNDVAQLDRSTAVTLAKQVLENLRYGYKSEIVTETRFLMDVAMWFGLGDEMELGCVARGSAIDLRIERVPTNITNALNPGTGTAGGVVNEGHGLGRDLADVVRVAAGHVTEEEANFDHLTTLHSSNHEDDGEHEHEHEHTGDGGHGGAENEAGHTQGQAQAQIQAPVQRFMISWKVSIGLLQGRFEIPVSIPGPNPTMNGGGNNNHDDKHGGGSSDSGNGNGNGIGLGEMEMDIDDDDEEDEGDDEDGNDNENWKMKFEKLQQEFEEERMKTRQAIVAALF
ncbi:MAG: hypothetical protein M1823_002129 [Watsoniomyces obsoletus]|nr:MAG: hypothetical protein M1823_002129 [Watsoniomyces obsoletus]